MKPNDSASKFFRLRFSRSGWIAVATSFALFAIVLICQPAFKGMLLASYNDSVPELNKLRQSLYQHAKWTRYVLNWEFQEVRPRDP
jgi:hypothetical protein